MIVKEMGRGGEGGVIEPHEIFIWILEYNSRYSARGEYCVDWSGLYAACLQDIIIKSYVLNYLARQTISAVPPLGTILQYQPGVPNARR